MFYRYIIILFYVLNLNNPFNYYNTVYTTNKLYNFINEISLNNDEKFLLNKTKTTKLKIVYCS